MFPKAGPRQISTHSRVDEEVVGAVTQWGALRQQAELTTATHDNTGEFTTQNGEQKKPGMIG